MITPMLALIIFLLVVGTLVILPLAPAWREWRHPNDCRALPVLRAYTSDIDFFANEFRRRVIVDGATRQALTRSLFDYIRVPIEQMNWHAAQRPLISSIAIRIRDVIRCTPPLFVRDDIKVDHGSHFNALLATGAITLGPGTEIHQWAHADDALRLGKKSIGLRRLSSNVLVELGESCYFERINAPTIRFGTQVPAPFPAMHRLPTRSEFSDLPYAKRRTPSLHRVTGDCSLPPGRLYTGSLVVTGALTIGDDTIVLGDVKARKGIRVGRHARIEGAVVCEQQIDVLHGAWLHGPVIAETGVYLAAGVRVGTPIQRTTISAAAIVADSGAVAHGTVWAHEVGMVWSE